MKWVVTTDVMVVERHLNDSIRAIKKARNESIINDMWRELAVNSASTALNSVAKENEQPLVKEIINSISHTTRTIGDTVQFILQTGVLDAGASAVDILRTQDLLMQLRQVNHAELFDLIKEWVTLHKRKDNRDFKKNGRKMTDDEIARRIYNIIFHRYPTDNTIGAVSRLLGSKSKNSLGQFLIGMGIQLPSIVAPDGMADRGRTDRSVAEGKERGILLLSVVRAAWIRMLQEHVWRYVRDNIRSKIRQVFQDGPF